MTAADRRHREAAGGVAPLLQIPATDPGRALSEAFRTVGFFVHRSGPDEYLVTSKVLDPSGDHPVSVRAVRSADGSGLRMEILWAGGAPTLSHLFRAGSLAHAVTRGLPGGTTSDLVQQIETNLAALVANHAGADAGEQQFAEVVELRSRPVTVVVERIGRSAAGPRADHQPIIARQDRPDGFRVLVSALPTRNEMTIAVAASGPSWHGTVVTATVGDSHENATSHLITLLGDGEGARGRTVVSVRSDTPTVTVDPHERPIGTLTAADADAIRRMILGADGPTARFWVEVAALRPSRDPIARAVLGQRG